MKMNELPEQMSCFLWRWNVAPPTRQKSPCRLASRQEATRVTHDASWEEVRTSQELLAPSY